MVQFRNDTALKINALTGGGGGGGEGSGEVFADAAWSVHPLGNSAEALIWIKAIPTALRRYIKFQARIGGSTIVDLSPATGFHRITTGLTNAVANNVEIRVVSFGNNSNAFYARVLLDEDWQAGTIGGWSSIKTVTPVATGNTAVNTAGWAAALSGAAAGQRLRLAAGTYSNLVLSSKVFTTNPLIIMADSPGAKPVIPGLTLNTVEGVYYLNLDFQIAVPNNTGRSEPLTSINSAVKHQTFDGCNFVSGVVASHSTDSFVVGKGSGCPFSLNTGNDHWFWNGCLFDRFGYHILLDQCDYASVFGCTHTRSTGDNIQGHAARGILIEYCLFKDWDFAPNDPAHGDVFQIFHVSASRAASDIVFRYNKIGGQACLNDVQGVLIKSEQGISGIGRIQRVLVYENHVYLTSIHLATVYDCDGVHVWNNTGIRNRLAAGVGSYVYAPPAQASITVGDAFNPVIEIEGPNTYAKNNVATSVIAGVLTGNYIISINSPNGANGYNTQFISTAGDGVADAMKGEGLLSNMVAKPGSTIKVNNHGAAFARP